MIMGEETKGCRRSMVWRAGQESCVELKVVLSEKSKLWRASVSISCAVGSDNGLTSIEYFASHGCRVHEKKEFD